MGILNVTPDSFSDGNQFFDGDAAFSQAETMVADGVDIIDIGGESTRPGAAIVTVEEEIRRVVPLIRRVSRLGVKVSVDTSKPEVMLAAAESGVSMINDVRALKLPGAMQAAHKSGLPVCLMHMQGKPATMQREPRYDNVLSQVLDYLASRVEACVSAGITRSKLSVDPGFGFGKTRQHNIELLDNLNYFKQLELPLLVGLSRKSLIGEITGRPVDERLAGSLAVALIAMQQGASIVRVHDVKETVDVKKVFTAMQKKINAYNLGDGNVR